MSSLNKLAGKSGKLTVNGTTIAFKKITPKVTRKLADTTDSADYDAGSDMMTPSQLPVLVGVELAVEGNYNLVTTPAAITSLLFSSATAVPCVITLATGVVFGHGNFDIADFTPDLPVDDTVTFTLNLKINGPFTAGS